MQLLLFLNSFHLDHCAALPYFMQRTTFKGKVLMTHPTKAIFKWMLSDFVRVTSVANHDAEHEQLYMDEDLEACFPKIEVIDYRTEWEWQGIKVIALNAGHVLGAAMFLIEIAGTRVLYTGDYSREEDRHLMAAEFPPKPYPEVLVVESTYGVSSHQPRHIRETRFTSFIHKVVSRGGRCLIPVFALGRAQELLLILDEFWQAHPELHSVPIYYASSLAKRCMAVYQTYVNQMNQHIREQIGTGNNPFLFKHITNLRSPKEFEDKGPCVIMASPAMMQSGFSRELLEAWCSDARNGLLIPGYVIDGTMGKVVMSEPTDITALTGAILPFRMSVEYISFSAHVDYAQNSAFINALQPPHTILVHGGQEEMGRLRVALQHRYTPDVMRIYTPRNCEPVNLTFQGSRYVRIVGQLASQLADAISTEDAGSKAMEVEKDYKDAPTTDADDALCVNFKGVLVAKDYEYKLMSEEDVTEQTGLKRLNFKERARVTCKALPPLVHDLLVSIFGRKQVQMERVNGVPALPSLDLKKSSQLSLSQSGGNAPPLLNNVHTIFIMDKRFKLEYHGSHLYVLEWDASPALDVIADSIMACLYTADTCRASVKATESHSSHHHHGSQAKGKAVDDPTERNPLDFLDIIRKYLEAQVGPTEESLEEEPCFLVSVLGRRVKISLEDLSVSKAELVPNDIHIDGMQSDQESEGMLSSTTEEEFTDEVLDRQALDYVQKAIEEVKRIIVIPSLSSLAYNE